MIWITTAWSTAAVVFSFAHFLFATKSTVHAANMKKIIIINYSLMPQQSILKWSIYWQCAIIRASAMSTAKFEHVARECSSTTEIRIHRTYSTCVTIHKIRLMCCCFLVYTLWFGRFLIRSCIQFVVTTHECLLKFGNNLLLVRYGAACRYLSEYIDADLALKWET